MNRTSFKVFYGLAFYSPDSRIEIGRATLTDNRVKFVAHESQHTWLEEQSHGFLVDLRANVSKLCKSVGHAGKYFSSNDTETGVCVERQ